MRPLDRLGSIKLKLGATIVAAVIVTTVSVYAGLQAGLGWLSALVALVLSLVAIHFLARGMTSPLREMAHAATAMAKGDYSRRVTATSRDEVGELARSFNQMSAELAEVDRFRKDLIADVSHELRTPIAALQAVLENIMDGVETADDESFRVMLTQVQRLGTLVGQLLDLSKLEAGAVPLDKREFDVAALVDEVFATSELHRRATDRHVTLTRSVDQDIIGLGDPDRLHQVISNLVDNAIRHSPDGGRVLVSARRDASELTIEVADEGPGISHADAAHVFDRFYRSDDGGTGLGLSIARWVVDLHGGDIRVGDATGSGCVMVVSLPSEAA